MSKKHKYLSIFAAYNFLCGLGVGMILLNLVGNFTILMFGVVAAFIGLMLWAAFRTQYSKHLGL